MSTRLRKVTPQVVFALVGAGLGVAVDRSTKSSNWALSIAIMLVASTSIGLLVIFQDTAEHQQDILESFLDSAQLGAGRLIELYSGLEASLPLTVDIQVVDDVNGGFEPDRVSVMMAAVQDSLLILDLLGDDGLTADSVLSSRIRSEHLSRMDQLLDKPNIEYLRICQSANPELLMNVLDDEYLDHLRRITTASVNRRRSTALFSAPVVFPYKFAILDRKTLVLQLQFQADDGQMRLDSEVVIRDAHRELVRVFESMWRRVQSDARTFLVQDGYL